MGGQEEGSTSHVGVPVLPPCDSVAWTGCDCHMEDCGLVGVDADLLLDICHGDDGAGAQLPCFGMGLFTRDVESDRDSQVADSVLVPVHVCDLADGGVWDSLDLGVADCAQDADLYLVVEALWRKRAHEELATGSSQPNAGTDRAHGRPTSF